MPFDAFIMHDNGDQRVAELTAEDVVISSSQDLLEILGAFWGQEVDALIVREHQVAPAFFDLSTGIAGDILQKCSNYNVRLALVGDYGRYPSESLQAFIRESNRGRIVRFVASVEDALAD